ncbi:MAG: WG repeat-containing protein [Bacteroidota bacterium]
MKKNKWKSWLDKKVAAAGLYKIVGGQKFKEDTIHCFVSDKRYWGVQKKNAAGKYEVLFPPIFNSVGYVPSRDLIDAYVYKDDAYALGENTLFLYSTAGHLLAEFHHIDTLLFDKLGHAILYKNQKAGVLNKDYELCIPCEYPKLRAVGKDVFIAQKFDISRADGYKEHNHSFNGILSVEHEILGDFPFDHDLFHDLHDHKLILREDKRYDGIDIQYHTYDIQSKQKTRLPYDEIHMADFDYYFEGPPIYRTVKEVDYDQDFDASFQVRSTSMAEFIPGQWGAIRPNGQIVLPNEYDYVEQLSRAYFKVARGRARAVIDEANNELYLENLQWGIVDQHNNIVLDIAYDWVWLDTQNKGFRTNKGGTIKWDFKQHKPEWEVRGGTFNHQSLPS